MKPPYWMSRLILVCWGGHLALFTLLAPDSISGIAVHRMGGTGFVCILMLALLSICGLVDSVANDFLPARCAPTLRDYRHVGFMAMALTLVVLGGGITLKSGVTIILLSYLLPAFFATVVTWQDLFSRHGASA